jgi:hypothetical protein
VMYLVLKKYQQGISIRCLYWNRTSLFSAFPDFVLPTMESCEIPVIFSFGQKLNTIETNAQQRAYSSDGQNIS